MDVGLNARFVFSWRLLPFVESTSQISPGPNFPSMEGLSTTANVDPSAVQVKLRGYA